MGYRGPRWSDGRSHLRQLFDSALAAADPIAAVRRDLDLTGSILRAGPHRLPLAPEARIWLVALGKASLAMARAAIDLLGDRLAGGVVAHPRGLAPGVGWPERVRLCPAGHPRPDEGSLLAGEAALELMRRCAAGAAPPAGRGGRARDEGDVALVLVSGGGSALLEALPAGVSLDDLRMVTGSLLRAGATIEELNTVRRALSRVKGGRLRLQAGAARCVTLLLSDVVGDRPEAIASGPTVPSPTGPSHALEVLKRHRLEATCPAIVRALAAHTVAPGGDSLWHIAASNRAALDAVGHRAQALGLRPIVVSDRLRGEARRMGRRIGALARDVARARRVALAADDGSPRPDAGSSSGAAGDARTAAAPICLVFGGETTVTVRGQGHGGRNLELALGAAQLLDGCERTAIFSFATDGEDGSSGAAGAVVTGDTMRRAAALGLSAERALAENDTEPFFRALGDLWISGPTGTNVNDVTLALIYG